MIQANKATVITDFYQQSLEVRQMELDYYLMVFDKLSTISALLGGFSSSSLMIGIPRNDNPYLVTCFFLSTGSSLGSMLLVVIVTTMCIMWGPGYALRGEDASYVDNAVYILDNIKSQMEGFFIFGMICYFVSSVLVVWLLFDSVGRIVVTSIFGVILVWLFVKSIRIYMHLVPAKIVSGHVKFNRIKNIGELMGDAKLSGNNGISADFATRA